MDTEKELFASIEKSYPERSGNTEQAKNIWKKILVNYPSENLPDFAIRPSLQLTRMAGDLGVALLWGAQATLIRPLLHAVIQDDSTLLAAIKTDSVGALAMVEDKENPFSVTEQNETLILNGKKKYITGGTASDFIFCTEKNNKDKKLSGITVLPVKDIPETNFKPLNMGCFSTSRHASLTLNGLTVSGDHRLPLDGRRIRKLLKSWGLIEQSMILESSTGLLLYLSDRIKIETGKTFSCIDEINNKLKILSSEIDRQIDSALKGDIVQPVQLNLDHLKSCLNELKQTDGEFPEELTMRFRDIEFFLGKL